MMEPKVIEDVRYRKARGEAVNAYYYDLRRLDREVEEMVRVLPASCRLFYAMKANPDSRLLQVIARHVHGFEAASLGEVKKARAVSDSLPIIFGGPGKTDDEIRGAFEHRVALLHVESLHELRRVCWIAESLKQPMSVLLRINLTGPFPVTQVQMAGQPTQFGMAESELKEAARLLQDHRDVRFKGFHFHSLSNHLDADKHLELIQLYDEKVREWKETFDLHGDILNVGGGIGINYEDLQHHFPWDSFTRRLEGWLSHRTQAPQLIFECGRFISASCGSYAVEVLDIKRNHGRNFIIVRGGTQHFRLPVSWNHSHPFDIVPVESWRYPFPRTGVTGEKATVVGQLCTPKDVFAKDVFFYNVRIGDVLLFRYTGAYGWTISHHDFLSHPRPQRIYLEEETADIEPRSVKSVRRLAP